MKIRQLIKKVISESYSNYEVLYHGTDLDSANNIVANGVDVSNYKTGRFLGFFLTPLKSLAEDIAKKKNGVVLEFLVDKNSLIKLEDITDENSLIKLEDITDENVISIEPNIFRRFSREAPYIDYVKSKWVLQNGFSGIVVHKNEVVLLNNDAVKNVKILNSESLSETFGSSSVVYTAVMIEDSIEIQKIEQLSKQYVPNTGWKKPRNYHMTIALGPIPNSLELRGDLNKEVDLEIITIGISGNAIALGTNGYYSKNEIPHITLGFVNGGEPANSKFIKDWQPIDKVIVTGVIREVGPGEQILK